ncbi:LptF/LptG family permease, partial [Planctomycetota bacterium]
MKRIDRYVIRLFLIFYLATLTGFITMMVVVDLSGKVGKFGSKGNFLVNFISHYIVLLPPLLNLLLPIVAVMAAIFTLVSLKRRNELVCLLASGISIHRIMGGICIILLLTVPLFYINSEIVVPYISRMKAASDDEILITTIITEHKV